MSLTLKDVEQVANLARLSLTDEEKSEFQKQLSAILDYVDRIRELDITGIPPTTHAIPLENVWREDVVTTQLTTEEALANAQNQELNQFKIQAVLDE